MDLLALYVTFEDLNVHQLLCFKSKFPHHFAFTLGSYLFLLFLVHLFNVEVNYILIYIDRERERENYSFSLKWYYLLILLEFW